MSTATMHSVTLADNRAELRRLIEGTYDLMGVLLADELNPEGATACNGEDGPEEAGSDWCAEGNGRDGAEEQTAELTPLERCARYEELFVSYHHELCAVASMLKIHVVHVRASLRALLGPEGREDEARFERAYAADVREGLKEVSDAADHLEHVAHCLSQWDREDDDVPVFYRGELAKLGRLR